MSQRTRVVESVRSLHPGSFAVVMATGIVSIAAQLAGLTALARALFILNGALYALLIALAVIRFLLAPASVAADVTDHARGPGFFTLVAATCIVGNQVSLLTGNAEITEWLWRIGLGLWLAMMYAILAGVTIRQQKPDLQTGLNGGWLLFVVATQAVAVLGAACAPRFAAHREVTFFLSLAMFLVGCMLYVIIISLIFYRWTFFRFDPEAMTPPYWINMGAVAITTRAGATLILSAPRWAFLRDILPFLKGFTLFFWATATWWIPLLVILTAWRHLHTRRPFAYDPQYWGMVFPLGMYTVCTGQLAQATGLSFLLAIPRCSVYLAIAAWALGFTGLLHSLGSAARPPSLSPLRDLSAEEDVRETEPVHA